MIVKTGRFGEVTVSSEELIEVPQGLIGVPEHKRFCLVDPGDDTLILWLQSLDDPTFALPLLEPKIFKSDYVVRLSGTELRELDLSNVSEALVFSVLTIPEDVTQMSANLKAPLVINLTKKLARQVVLQENTYAIKHLMFRELRTHLLTLSHQKSEGPVVSPEVVPVARLTKSDNVRFLNAP